MLLFEPLRLSIIFTPIFFVVNPKFPVLLPSFYSSSRTAVIFCPVSCFAAMMLTLLCFQPKVMPFLPCKWQGADVELWCCRKRSHFFSYSHASQPHTRGEGRSVPSPLGGTLGEKILCTWHNCSHSTLFTFLLPVHFWNVPGLWVWAHELSWSKLTVVGDNCVSLLPPHNICHLQDRSFDGCMWCTALQPSSPYYQPNNFREK